MSKRNENRPGYKKTKVGWIPEEWECDLLGKYVICYSGGTPSRSIKEYFNGNIPWIKSGELNNKFITTTMEYISENAVKESSTKYVEPDTLLYALYGATAGIPAFTKISAAINQAILAIIPAESLDKFYLFFWLLFAKNRLLAIYTQGGQPNLSGQLVKLYYIPLPPLPEQKKIAEILSAWDRAIEQVGKLIDAKQRFKKGLMQQLLTGRMRFAEFVKSITSEELEITNKKREMTLPVEWKEVKLGEIFEQIKEKVGRQKVTPFSISAGIGFVPQSEKWGKDISGKQYPNYIILNNSQFSYNKGNSKKYACGCAYLWKDEKKIAVPNVFISFKSKHDGICNEFYEQYFMANMWERELKKYISSSARSDGLLNLSNTNFFKVNVPYPTHSEQLRIAAVLSTCDREIELLKKKQEKLKEQKKGLMQKLLTGEIRVKSEK